MTHSRQLKIAIKALRDIVDPLAEIRAEAAATGKTMNGLGCVGILNNPGTYTQIAKRALRRMGRSTKWRNLAEREKEAR